jgi:UDP-glucose 4-epimerase
MVLLTGASGFIGKHLLSLLIEKYGKGKVVVLSSKPIVECDYILHHDYTFDNDIFVKSGFGQIEIIIHAGAYTPKKAIDANDVALCNSNIYNTEKLLNTNLPNLKKIIYISTVDVYGHDEMITENTLEKPVSLYGYSKLYAEKMIVSWGKENGRMTQILRVGHVYGPGEEAYQKIIPITIQKVLSGEKISIWGTGEELRSFIYIKDLVKAIVNAINIESNADIINIVGGKSITINELVKKIITLSNDEIEIEKIPSNVKGRNLVFDNSKMIEILLNKETDLEYGLVEEFEFMKKL